jgi:hypothetical protein
MGTTVMGGCSIVAARHEAVLWWRHGHAETGAGNVVDGVRQTREVLVPRLRREVIVKRVEMIILALEVILLVIAQRLAVSAGLVCATMSN